MCACACVCACVCVCDCDCVHHQHYVVENECYFHIVDMVVVIYCLWRQFPYKVTFACRVVAGAVVSPCVPCVVCCCAELPCSSAGCG